MVLFDAVILYELGYLPFLASGEALLFHLTSHLHEKTSLIISANLSFSEWVTVLDDSKITSALVDRITHHSEYSKPETILAASNSEKNPSYEPEQLDKFGR